MSSIRGVRLLSLVRSNGWHLRYGWRGARKEVNLYPQDSPVLVIIEGRAISCGTSECEGGLSPYGEQRHGGSVPPWRVSFFSAKRSPATGLI